MTLRSLPAVLTFLILASAPASAAEFKHSEAPFVPVHNCTCRINGEEVALGQRRCISTTEGSHSAICVTEQNVTSWRPSGEGCPQASLTTPRG